MLERWLLLWLVLISLVAWLWAGWFPAGFDPFVASRPYLGALITATMFAIGSLLPRDEVRHVLERWPTVLGGTAAQYAAMPLLAYVIGHAFGLDRDALVGVILVGCVPGAMASNVLTLTARGNVSYSVSLTTTATLLSPLVVPAALWLLLDLSGPVGQQIDPLAAGVTLLWQVVLPVVAGHLLARRCGTFAAVMKRLGPIAANLAILWIIATVVGLNRERLAESTPRLLAALLLVNVLGYAAGNAAGRLMRLPAPMRRALTLEIGMQNAGLGAFLAVQLFPEHGAIAIAPAAYTFGCMLTGTMLAQFWALTRRRDEVSPRELHQSEA